MRFLDLSNVGKKECSFYFALEQLLLQKQEEDLFFFWDIYPSVVVGRHQLINNEVNHEFLKENGIKLYRRPSGGGTVYADDGNFMFTFLTSLTSAKQAFVEHLNKIVEALKVIDVNAYLSGRNDLLIDNKKFSGNAFYLKQNRSILHGTFMYDVNIENLVKSITPNKEKLIAKGIESVRQRVVNLKDYTSLTKKEVMNHLASYITNGTVQLTKEDIAQIEKNEVKYLTREWIKGNNPSFDIFKEKRFEFGLVQASFKVIKNKINDFCLSGDFFSLASIEDLSQMLDNIEYEEDLITKALLPISVKDYIMGLSNEELIKLLIS